MRFRDNRVVQIVDGPLRSFDYELYRSVYLSDARLPTFRHIRR
jgi:hypothetical protein